MQYQPYLIAPFKTGLELDTEPWMLPADAFSTINNAHVHHGVIEKRSGSTKIDDFPETNTNLAISNISAANPAVVTVTSTADISDGDTVRIIDVTGTMSSLNNGTYTVANKTATTFELDGTNTVGLTYTSGGQVVFFPGERIMGIFNYIASDGTKETLAFTQTNVARFDGTLEMFIPMGDATAGYVDVMAGTTTDYVHAANWASAASSTAAPLYRLYFCNGRAYNAGPPVVDGIRYYDASSDNTVAFRPPLSATRFLDGATFLFVLNNRLLALSTIETDTGPVTTSYPQRARWCRPGVPGTPGGFGNEWYDTVAGRGGYADAPTGDHIVSAQQIENQIVVMFTNSIWTLRPTPDPARPFVWERINSIKACKGRFSSIAYDRTVVSIGDRGIVSTDLSETRRVDERIETFAQEEVNNAEFDKTYMQRNFSNRRMWMLYASEDSTEADAALIFDEESAAYSTYTIAMNVLGHIQFTQDEALDDFDEDASIDQEGDNTLRSYFQDNGESFAGGDRLGVIHLLDDTNTDNGTDYQMELESAAWNPFAKQGSRAQMGYVDLFVDVSESAYLNVEFYKDNQNSPYRSSRISLLPDVRELAPVTQINIKATPSNGVEVMAPDHGLATNDEVYIYGVEGMTSINGGPWTITVVDKDQFDIAVDATNFNAYTTNGIVAERSSYATKVWKRVYAGGVGYQHYVNVTSESDDSGIRIHAFTPWFRSRGRRMT